MRPRSRLSAVVLRLALAMSGLASAPGDLLAALAHRDTPPASCCCDDCSEPGGSEETSPPDCAECPRCTVAPAVLQTGAAPVVVASPVSDRLPERRASALPPGFDALIDPPPRPLRS